MNTRLATVFIGIFSLCASGCGTSSTANHAEEPRPASTSGPAEQIDSGGTPAPAGDSFQELSGYDWTVQAGEEKYWCGYKTLTDDLYISAFRPVMPQGTHHVVIGYFQTPEQPDGLFPDGTNGCTGVSFGDIYTYVGTVGTKDLPMPEGVAAKIPAGSQIVFGLHVNNPGTGPLSGHSAVEIKVPARSQVVDVAEVIAVLNPSLQIPPGKVVQTADCTMAADATIFAVMPHMHLMGKHMTTTTVHDGAPGPKLLDADYVFTEQLYTPLTPAVRLSKGDKIHVECDYENTTAKTMTFGESTNDGEMCITFAYRYPAVSADAPANSGFPRGNCWDGP